MTAGPAEVVKVGANIYVHGFGSAVGRWPPVTATAISRVGGGGGEPRCWARAGARQWRGYVGWMRANPWRTRLKEGGW